MNNSTHPLKMWCALMRTVIGSESIDPHTIRRTKKDAIAAYIAQHGEALTASNMQERRVRFAKVIVAVCV